MAANRNLTERMKSILTTDRLSQKEGLPDLIKSEAYSLLSDFFELDEDKIIVRIEPEKDGFIITVKAKAIRVF